MWMVVVRGKESKRLGKAMVSRSLWAGVWCSTVRRLPKGGPFSCDSSLTSPRFFEYVCAHFRGAEGGASALGWKDGRRE